MIQDPTKLRKRPALGRWVELEPFPRAADPMRPTAEAEAALGLLAAFCAAWERLQVAMVDRGQAKRREAEEWRRSRVRGGRTESEERHADQVRRWWS